MLFDSVMLYYFNFADVMYVIYVVYCPQMHIEFISIITLVRYGATRERLRGGGAKLREIKQLKDD